MHKCLSIHDILLLVFEQVDGYVFDDAGLNVVPLCREVASLHALAALARTCKGFQEPALDVLWRDIPDLFVLVKYALPSDALDYQEANRTLYIHNPDDASLWRTLDPFVRRIRAVGIPLPYEDSIGRVLDEGSVVEPLAKYLTDKGSGYAFPQLQEVTLHVSWLSQAYCTLLLNPQVRRLQLPSDWYGKDRITTALSRQRQPLAIQSLVLPRPLGAGRQALIQQSMCQMTQLEHVLIQPDFIDDSTWRHLSSLPKLTSLFVELSRMRYLNAATPRLDEHHTFPFHRLRHLVLPSVEPYLAALDFSSTQLQKITILWTSLQSRGFKISDHLRDTLDSVLISPRLTHLSVTMVSGALRSPILFQTHTLLFGQPCLSPLLRPSLSRLRVVKLDMGSVFKLGNDFIYNLAKALPSLKRFSALPESPGSFPSIHPSSPVEEMQTLDCLLAFVEHCPRLRELKIATLPRFSTGFVFRQGGDVPKAKKLRSLRLWTAPLETSGEHARDVGDFLAQTFPRVKRVDLGLFSVRLPDRAALYAGMLWREEALRRWEEIVDSLGSVDFYAVTFVDMKLYPSPRTFTW